MSYLLYTVYVSFHLRTVVYFLYLLDFGSKLEDSLLIHALTMYPWRGSDFSKASLTPSRSLPYVFFYTHHFTLGI